MLAGSLADQRRVLEEMLLLDPGEGELETGEELLFRRNGVQDSVVRKLRRGQISVQDHLDLHGLTLTGGKDGAIDNYNDLALTRCALFGNTSPGSGGAIFNAGRATVVSSTFSGNHAGQGGTGGNGGAGEPLPRLHASGHPSPVCDAL